MTITQIINDAAVWCKRFAIDETVGRPELKLLFYEAFQPSYEKAVLLFPSWFEKTFPFTASTSIALPADFREHDLIQCTDSDCTAGYARMVSRDDWDSRINSTRIAPTAADPIARLDAAAIVLSTSRTGLLYYIQNYSESNLSTESTDLDTILPTAFQQVCLLRMQELIRVRHFKVNENPGLAEQMAKLSQETSRKLRATLKSLYAIDASVEKPATLAR